MYYNPIHLLPIISYLIFFFESMLNNIPNQKAGDYVNTRIKIKLFNSKLYLTRLGKY